MRVSVFLGLLLPAAITLAAPNLGDIATVRERTSHRASSYDRKGGNTDSLMSVEPGSTHVLMEAEGPGVVTHIWTTLAVFPRNETFLRDLVIRMYWERSEVPSVEVPLGDFFALGHGKRYRVNSAPVSVGFHPMALNCYWPMPFYRHARIELFNSGQRSIRRLYYHVDYELGPIAERQGLFHAQFRRERDLRGQPMQGNTHGQDNYVVLDTSGEGQYLGCVLSVDAQSANSWYEGDDMIFIDGSESPTLHGTGTEDYFCNAWGYTEPFSNLYYGAPLLEKRPDGGLYATLYRWHIPDPIRFRKSIRVTFEHVYDQGLLNDYSSVAYWYQLEPVRSREPLPADNVPLDRSFLSEVDGTELEPLLRGAGIQARSIGTELNQGYRNGGYLLIEAPGRTIEIPLRAPHPGLWSVEVKPVNRLNDGNLRMGLRGGSMQTVAPWASASPRDSEAGVPFVNLGTVEAKDGQITLLLESSASAGIDMIRLRPAETR